MTVQYTIEPGVCQYSSHQAMYSHLLDLRLAGLARHLRGEQEVMVLVCNQVTCGAV